MISVTPTGEIISDNYIGSFKDKRLAAFGEKLMGLMIQKMSSCLKFLGGNRANEVAIGRFLGNDKVTVDELSQTAGKKANIACLDKHVLVIQDTVQLSYPTQSKKKEAFGCVSDCSTRGIHVHPGIVVDAENRELLGVSSLLAWNRSEANVREKRKELPIEFKESRRWLDTALHSRSVLSQAKCITVIGDRESDIFDVLQRVPDERTHIIVRAHHDRKLVDLEKLSSAVHDTQVVGYHEIDLPAITGQRKARRARLAIKYTRVKIYSQRLEEEVELNCIHAREQGKSCKAINWLLLTSHAIENLEKAIQILNWYTWRWTIEQVFRTMKNQGLEVESSQIATPEKLIILSVLAVLVAVRVMILVQAREGKTNRVAKEVFDSKEEEFLEVIEKKLCGKTQLQKNPFKKNSLSWACWIIARLGGWNGYSKGGLPGPITMFRGLKVFETQLQGWLLHFE